jgi:hypothetical protein
MSIDNLTRAKALKVAGARLGRAGLAERALAIAQEIVADGSYKGAIRGVGRMKALAQACGYDDYWSEKRDDGYYDEVHKLQHQPLDTSALPR